MNPVLRAECEAVLPVLAQRNQPIGAEDLMGLLIRQAPAFGIQAKGADEWAALFDVYIETLEDMPWEAVDEAFARWNRCEMYPKEPGRHAFFPRPPELYAMAQETRVKLGAAVYRARKALIRIEQTTKPNLSPQERQANVDALQGVLSTLKATAASQQAVVAPAKPTEPLSDLAKRMIAQGLANTAPPPSVAPLRGIDPGDDIV